MIMVMTLISGGKYKAQQVLEARWWIADYSSRDKSGGLGELTEDQVIEVIDRHYFGGWKQFGRDIESGFVAD
jgi:hypothetical protein